MAMAEIISRYLPYLLDVPNQCTQSCTEFSHASAHRDSGVSTYSQGEDGILGIEMRYRK